MTDMLPIPAAPPLPLVEETFASEYARHNDMKLAWRVATGRHEVGNLLALQAATHMLETSGVAARVSEIRQQAADLSGLNVASVLRHWYNLALADPTEVVQFRRVCCRFCWGTGGQYQYTDAEYTAEGLQAVADGREMNTAGGPGFDKSRGPNPGCSECAGDGVGDIHITDSRLLTERGKLLFDGVEMNKYGVKVHLNSRTEALNNLARFFGMYQERLRVEEVIKGPAQAERVERDLTGMALPDLVGLFRELTEKQPPRK